MVFESIESYAHPLDECDLHLASRSQLKFVKDSRLGWEFECILIAKSLRQILNQASVFKQIEG